MPENNMVPFRTEGDKAFPDIEKDNSTSSPEDTTKTEETHSSEGGDASKTTTDNIPFDKHPAWAEREKKWDSRFNEQEVRHQDEMKKIREEFIGSRKTSELPTDIPSWFGGTKDQWDAYKTDEDKKLHDAEERAFKRISETKEAEDKLVKDATAYMQSELTAIENDKELNPSGEKIDPNKLLKFVMDNNLVDQNLKWNYRAGWKFMKASEVTTPKGNRKEIAGATTTESRPETKPTSFKTPEDFKKNRPW